MIYPVILCGGSGTRLWPLSREMYPKQFINFGEGRTLFKDTVCRAMNISDSVSPLIVCNEEHRFYVSTSFLECGISGRILLEPEARNTAPAIAFAAFVVQKLEPDGILLVLPSDHMLRDEKTFVDTVQSAVSAAQKGFIITFGITPLYPATGFGYIQQGETLSDGGYRVARFVEKPDGKTAASMLSQRSYLWNSGMFMFSASTYLRELKIYAPKIFEHCLQAWEERKEDGAFIRPGRAAFTTSPSNSIDYAVMKYTAHAAVFPLCSDWDDLGSWEAFYQTGKKDVSGNICTGDVIVEDARGCYLYGTSRLVAALNVENLAVIETKDAVLVAQRDAVHNVKSIVARLKDKDRQEYRLYPLVYRPWGIYESLAMGPRFQVKRIVVNPGAQLSLQLHHHRAEHWVVVSGVAEVTVDTLVKRIEENQSIYIPVKTKHRLCNPGSEPLIVIEIQSGSYLGEDDIVRFEDVYGREN